MKLRRILVAVVLGLAGLPRCGVAAPLDDIRRAEALIEVERFDRALALLKGIEIETPQQAQRLDLALGRIYLGTGRPAQALEYFEHASTESLDDADGLAGMAQAELALGRFHDAVRDAGAALRSDSGAVAPRLVLAQVADRGGKRAEGDAQLAALARDLPDSEEVAVARAKFAATSNRNGALAQLDDFVRRHPFAPQAEDALGALQWALGKRDIAMAHRRHAAEQFATKGDTARAEAITAWIEGAETLPVEKKPEAPVRPGAPGTLAPPANRPPSPMREAAGPQQPFDPHAPGGAATNTPTAFPFEPDAFGSGLVLEGGRWILTNRHVIEEGHKFAVRNGLGQMRTAKVIAVSKKADLALLEIAEPFPDEDGFPLSQLTVARTGRRLMVLGYPIPWEMGLDVPSLTEGTVSKESGLQEEPGVFQMTARIQPGNSGGPVFDRYGDLVGLSVAMLNKEYIVKKYGREPMDVGMAVDAESISQFLKVGLNANPTQDQEVDPEAFYQQVLSRVVLVGAKIKK